MLPEFDGYKTIEVIGQGALGTVYKALDNNTQQLVAIKLLREEMRAQPRVVARFKREIRACMQLEHPNLIRAHAAGQLESGSWFIVLEYIEGQTAHQLLISKGVFDERAATEVGLRVAEGLSYAGGYELVHRDIKPDNIMLTRTGEVKLCDMGLAKSMDSQNELTLQGTVLGTPHYLAPELAEGEQAELRSDIYSLGATLYHLLTGTLPFGSGSPFEVLQKVISSDPVPMQDIRPGLSEQVCQIVAKMMTKCKEERYQTHDEVICDLKLALDGMQTEVEKGGRFKTSSSTPARESHYEFCYVPSAWDMLFARTALKAKLVTPAGLIPFLDQQEAAAQIGAILRLADVLAAAGAITAAQVYLGEQALHKYALTRADELFLQVAVEDGVIEASQMAAARKQQGGKLPSQVLIEQGAISPEQHRQILVRQQKLKVWEEEQTFCRIGVRSGFLVDKQARKCLTISSNLVAGGQYMHVADVLVEREFLSPAHRAVLLRAIRRSKLIECSPAELIDAKRLD